MLVLYLVVSTAEACWHRAQRLRDTVNAAVLRGECRLSREHVEESAPMAPKKSRRDQPPALPFDVTQEIDPALVEDVRRSETTLTQTDFDEITLVLPEKRQPKP